VRCQHRLAPAAPLSERAPIRAEEPTPSRLASIALLISSAAVGVRLEGERPGTPRRLPPPPPAQPTAYADLIDRFPAQRARRVRASRRLFSTCLWLACRETLRAVDPSVTPQILGSTWAANRVLPPGRLLALSKLANAQHTALQGQRSRGAAPAQRRAAGRGCCSAGHREVTAPLAALQHQRRAAGPSLEPDQSRARMFSVQWRRGLVGHAQRHWRRTRHGTPPPSTAKHQDPARRR